MDGLEEEADDYDEYDMDQGSEGDMEGEFLRLLWSTCNVDY